MNRFEIDTLVEKFRAGEISRRGFMRRATALGVSAAAAGMLVRDAAGQTPEASPAGTGEVVTSPNREDALAEIESAFPFEEPQVEGGQLIHVMTTDISTTNTVLTSDTYSGWITGFIYDGLIGASVATGLETPTGLAESWEIAEDGVTYTLNLMQGIKWHDGEDFTADDVIMTFDKALAENSQSVRKATIDEVLESYEKIDDYTVQFKAKFQTALFLTDALSQFGIMPEHIWGDVDPADWPSDAGSTGQDASRVVGTGAFKFVEWVLGDHVTLEKNPDYWDTTNIPTIDTYTYQVIADPASAIAALQTGQADVAEIPFCAGKFTARVQPGAQHRRLRHPELQLLHHQPGPGEGRGLHGRQRPQGPPLRAGPQHHRRHGLRRLTRSRQMAPSRCSPSPMRRTASTRSTTTIRRRPSPSSRSRVGPSGGDGIREKDGQRLSFDCTYSEGASTYETQIPYMQQAWREVGVEMLPSAIPFPTLLENNDAGNFQMSVLGFSWSVDGGQHVMFGSEYTPPQGFNMMRYSNPDYDALIQPSLTELDVEKRIDILIEMSNIVERRHGRGYHRVPQEHHGCFSARAQLLPERLQQRLVDYPGVARRGLNTKASRRQEGWPHGHPSSCDVVQCETESRFPWPTNRPSWSSLLVTCPCRFPDSR